MKKWVFRDLATSMTAMVFVVIGTTGVLLYFHLFEVQVKSLHEILGLVFVGAALLHVFFNWKSMQRYFSKPLFLSVAIAVAATAVVFVSRAGTEGVNPKTAMIRAVLSAPLEEAAHLLGSSKEAATARLESQGVRVGEAVSLQAVAEANGLSPFQVVLYVLPPQPDAARPASE